MFFIKIIPLMIHWMIHKGKTVGPSNSFVYTISFIAWVVIMHTFQIYLVVYFLFDNDYDNPEKEQWYYGGIIFLITYAILYYILSKLYNKKRLGRWYAENKEKKFMKYSTPIIWAYIFLNLAITLAVFVKMS